MGTAEGIVTRRGTCPVCGFGCQVVTELHNGQPVRVKPDRTSPLPADCARAGQAVTCHDHPDRVNYPVKRVGGRAAGQWERISWDQAIDEIAEKLRSVRKRFGPEALLMLGGSHKGAADAAAWRWCHLWGTPNYMHLGKNCGEAEFLAEWAVYGSTSVYGSRPEPTVTKCVVLWGLNPPDAWTASQSKAHFDAVKRGGMKLIVVDPRRSASAQRADIWLQLRPGTDGALAYGMLHVIINEDLYDHSFVERWCLGFDRLRQLVQFYTPERVSSITWVPALQIIEAARCYATSRPANLTFGLGTGVSGKATLSAVLGKAWLRAITGNLDVPGGQLLSDVPREIAYLDEIYRERLIDHPQRTRDNVSAHLWPIASVQGLQTYREAMQRVFPQGVGAASYMVYPAPSCCWSAILDEDPYPIKAVVTQGTNSLVALANGRRIYKALMSDKLELHVAMDQWRTPQTELADYLLPATDGLERPNLVGMWGFGGAAGAAGRTVTPLYERRDDYELWRDLGNRLGQQGYWPETLEGWFDKLLTPSNVSFADLIARDSTWVVTEPEYRRHERRGFATFSGKVELASGVLERLAYDAMPEYQEPVWSPVSTPELAQQYPLVLTTGACSKFYYRSQHRQLPSMRRQHQYAELQIHPAKAQELAISDGDWVYVETPLGRVRQKAVLFDGIHPDVVHADALWWYPEQGPPLFGVWESNINAILPDDPDHSDFAGDNHFRGLLCRVYRA